MNIVKIMADAGVPERIRAQKMNCAEPAYTSMVSSAISNNFNPEADPTTPKANPMLMYPNNVGIQSLIPCRKESSS